MRLATFNILHGLSLTDGQVSTSRLAEACASLDADVLALQEVDRHQPRSGGADQTAAVAEVMGATAWRFAPALIGVPGLRGPNAVVGATWRAATGDPADDNEPGYGVALVSRRPVQDWHVVRLPAAPVRSPVVVPGGRGRFILLPDEPRVALVADLGDLVVATTHLSFVPGYNLVQLRRLSRDLRRGGRPCVLLGDLNVPGPAPALATGWRPLVRAKTFPADRPALQVDHVLASGAVPATTAVEVRRMPLSDHRAVVVTIGG